MNIYLVEVNKTGNSQRYWLVRALTKEDARSMVYEIFIQRENEERKHLGLSAKIYKKDIIMCEDVRDLFTCSTFLYNIEDDESWGV